MYFHGGYHPQLEERILEPNWHNSQIFFQPFCVSYIAAWFNNPLFCIAKKELLLSYKKEARMTDHLMISEFQDHN
jgi:hypothetical protein